MPVFRTIADFLQARLRLVILGVSMELVYLLYFVRRFGLLDSYHVDVGMGQISGFSHGAFAVFVLLFTLLFVLFVIAWREVSDADDQGTLWLVLGFAAMFAVTMVFVYPITAIDIFVYFDWGLVLVHYHANPFFVPPSHFSADPLMALADGWAGNVTPYGPLGSTINGLPVLVAGRDLLANLILLKLIFSAAAVGSGFVTYRLLRHTQPRLAVGGALLVAWNPLVIFESSANGHNDIAMMFFALLGLLSIARGERTTGTVFILISALVKYASLALLPVVLVYGLAREESWRARVIYALKTGGILALVTVIAFSRFWDGIDTLRGVASQNDRYFASFSAALNALFPDNISLHTAALAGRVLFAVIFLYALWLARGDFAQLLQACFLVLLGLVLFGVTNFLGWYAIWPVVVAASLPWLPGRLAGVMLSWCIAMTYAVTNFVWNWLLSAGDPHTLAIINVSAYLIAFVPALIVLIGLTLWDDSIRLHALTTRHRETKAPVMVDDATG